MLATQDKFIDAEERLGRTGAWIVGAIETRNFWPTRPQLIIFEGLEFILQPAQTNRGGDSLPAIAMRTYDNGLSDIEARAAIMRLATSIAWRDGQKVELVMWGGGGRPYPMGIARNNHITHYFSSENLYVPGSVEAKKALAYYREGVSLDNPFYSFLSFFKSFSRSIPDGRERGPWIVDALGRLDDPYAISRRDELLAENVDISTYVAVQGRHAIAHAERGDIVNPDDPEDHCRITLDLPLIRNLSELAMEQFLEIPRPQSYHKNHLYELEGFRELFDTAGLAALKRGLAPEKDYEIPGHYYVLARKGHQIAPLGMLVLTAFCMDDGKIVLRLEKLPGRIGMIVRLDFINERLLFDPLHDIGLSNPGRNNRADVADELALCEFNWCMFCNGQIEIWDETGMRRLGISEPYILTNMMLDHDVHQMRLNELTTLLDQFPHDPPMD